MARRSKIAQLPPQLKEWLDEALLRSNFSAYEQLAAELKARGAELGLSADVSKSGLHRYGSNLEKRLAAIKASTEAARLIANSAPDDADQRSAAVISLIQTEVFDVLVALQDLDGADPMKRAKLLATIAKNVATLSRASVGQKKHELEVRARTQAVADKVARLAKKGGMSGATVESIKREILGIGG